MFSDRKEAGRKLAEALEKFRDEDPLVLAIPRGGVEVGYEVASGLDADLSILVTRKLPFPHNPEAGFGAVAEDGTVFMFEGAGKWVDGIEVHRIVEEQKEEAARRVRALREGRDLPPLKNRTVILVDDGIAMGSTMTASIMMCRGREAGKIVVAAPVSGQSTAQRMGELADEAVILETPPGFRAVAESYEMWYDVPDGEVIDIFNRWKKTGSG